MATSTEWQLAREAAERYQQILVPTILGPAAQALTEWSGLQNGDTVLDVGCGTGAAARFAAKQVGSVGRVIGIDVNAGMLEVARSQPPVEGVVIEYQDKSAYELPLADQSVDVVLCAQTLQFLNERHLALSEVHRVLRPSGRAAVSLWCDIQESPYFHALVEAVARHINRETAMGLKAAFSLSRTDEIHSLVGDAGFQRIEMTVKQLDLQLPNLTDFVPRHISATPMSVGFNAASQAAQEAVVQDVLQQLVSYETDAGVNVPFRTHLVMATV